MNLFARLSILREGETRDGVNCLTAPDRWGQGNSCEVESAEFYRALCRRYKPKRVIHSGSHFGYDVAWIAMGLAENGTGYPHMLGKVITVDVNDYGASKLWEKLELTNIVQIIGDSRLPETYEGKVDAPCQWVHYDADHSAESLLAEFEATLTYMDPNTCIISSHDTRLDERLAPGIREIIRRLEDMRSKGEGWKHIGHFPLRNLRGLDLILLSNEDL